MLVVLKALFPDTLKLLLLNTLLPIEFTANNLLPETLKPLALNIRLPVFVIGINLLP
jgi:hypothetical protein